METMYCAPLTHLVCLLHPEGSMMTQRSTHSTVVCEYCLWVCLWACLWSNLIWVCFKGFDILNNGIKWQCIEKQQNKWKLEEHETELDLMCDWIPVIESKIFLQPSKNQTKYFTDVFFQRVRWIMRYNTGGFFLNIPLIRSLHNKKKSLAFKIHFDDWYSRKKVVHNL